MSFSSSFSEDEVYFYLPTSFLDSPSELPKRDALVEDRSYPQLSSQAFYYFAYKDIKEPRQFLPCYSLIDVSSEGLFVCGTNDFTSTVFMGNFIGVENFESIVQKNIEKTEFVIQKYSTLTGLKFLESSMFLTATIDDTVELHTARSAMHDGKSYRISVLNTEGSVKNIEKLYGDTKFIVGTDNGNLTIYDYGNSETICYRDIPYAHESPVTGISPHPFSPNMWTSCAGFECLLWDKSKEKPALSILNHQHELTAVHWTSQEENKELIVLGDELGNVLTIDPRVPNRILNSTRVSNRPISGLFFNGSNRFGMISSNVVKILEFVSNEQDLKQVFRYETKQILYSMCWDTTNKSMFYVVGDNKTALKFCVT